MYEFFGDSKSKLILYDDRVELYLEKFPLANQRKMVIFLSNISGIEIRKPGLVNGAIRILSPAVSDNSSWIPFSKKEQYQEALDIKRRIEDLLDSNTNHENSNNFSAADEIRKLKELLDIDAITKEEFEAKKKQLLGL